MEYINIEYYRNCYDIVTPIIDKIHSFTCKRDFEYIQNYNEKSIEIFKLRDSERYNNLELSKFSERLKMIYNIARYEIIMIAANTGYSQGNYHIENLFLYEELNSILVTDFENVKHIPKYENIQNNWFFLEENDFKQEKDALRVLKEIVEDIYNTHYQDNDENSDHYKWLKNIDQEDVTIIYNLHTFRKFMVVFCCDIIPAFSMFIVSNESRRVPEHIDINKTIEEELVTYILIPATRDNKEVPNTGTNSLRLTSVRNVTAGEAFTLTNE
jgi:hypothetical protein